MNHHVSVVPGHSEDQEKESSGEASEAADREAAETTESGGPSGPEPTRFGDWERNGRCIDF